MPVQRELVYLALPYSHPYPAVRQARFEAANRFAAWLIRETHCHVFSSISHSHPIACAAELPTDWDYWADFDKRMIRACDNMVVLMLDGWLESKGVVAEVVYARKVGKPIRFMESEI